ncbi:uncharacterized protein BDR25DRAFT_297165 [Lindgomyces ingoldianus]|uniref:Uncharacterized protein n=1 Tax=Lindgomyces ingoldianus TaxID=673940 RepID=A0ACB6QD95_9PLEO|nr:uncharacterized protein BDR25DRAFT_297165 [Lindgomyces ingoldianus]KAF2464092.1 hypothetical protein BDR25DRAFT_297165 [Lindgomyces ingoldianus]
MARQSKSPPQYLSQDVSSPALESSTDTPQPTLRRAKAKVPKPGPVDWSALDATGFTGFTINFPHPKTLEKASKKRKLAETELHKNSKLKENLDENGNLKQFNPFPGSALPDLNYEILPAEYWEATSRYRKFTILKETFSVDDFVFIKASEEQDPDPNATVKGWVAKVLEVRAGDEQHVFLRVYWMYRPEDLPKGRQPYHGENELIASNYMQIVDATTVDSKAEVKHWVEQSNQNEVLDPNQLFWRQTLNVVPGLENPKLKGKTVISELPTHCIDNTPCNPDKLLIQCPHCNTWLHGPCLENDAIDNEYKSHNIHSGASAGLGKQEPTNSQPTTPSASQANSKKRRRSSGITSANGTPTKRGRKKSVLTGRAASTFQPARISEDLFFSAQVVMLESEKVQMIITDERPNQGKKTWEAPLRCLKCGEDIEDSGQNAEISVAAKEEDIKTDDNIQVDGEASSLAREALPRRQKELSPDSVINREEEQEDVDEEREEEEGNEWVLDKEALAGASEPSMSEQSGDATMETI